MQQLLEVMRNANLRPDPTAADPEARALVRKLLLDPVEKRVVDGGLCSAARPKRKGNRPQFIAEYRVETPGDDELIPRIRIALEAGGGKKGEVSKRLYVGVTVCQAWVDNDRRRPSEYPAHIRWGAWSHTPAVADAIGGPFRRVARSLDWPETTVFDPRPVINMAGFTLSMIGKQRREEDLAETTLDELTAEISADILALEKAIRRQPA